MPLYLPCELLAKFDQLGSDHILAIRLSAVAAEVFLVLCFGLVEWRGGDEFGHDGIGKLLLDRKSVV